MGQVSLPVRILVMGACLGLAFLLQNRDLRTWWLNTFDHRYQSPRPYMTYTQLTSFKRGRDSGERLGSAYFADLTYSQGLASGKPVVLLTQTPGCAANDHATQLVEAVKGQYQGQFSFVTLRPQGMALSVPPADPINRLIYVCHTSICVANPQTQFVLAFDTLPETTANDLAFALNDYLERSRRF